MGLPLTHPSEGSVGWFSSMDANLTKLENEFVGRQNSDASVVTVSGTTAETALMTSTSIPANTLAAGMVLSILASGVVSVATSTTPTVTFRLRWGGLAGTLLWSSAWNYGSAAAYDISWYNQNVLVCVTAGASGTVEQQGWAFTGSTFAGGFNNSTTVIDTTATKQLVWTVQSTLSSTTITQRLLVVNRG